jgi:hypothetical protein
MSQTPSVGMQDAEAIFERLRPLLEAEHLHEFLAIEPVSGRYFPGRTLSEAVGASRGEFPDRLAYGFRVGHVAAIQMVGLKFLVPRTIRLDPEQQLSFWNALHEPVELAEQQQKLGRIMRGLE